MPHPIENHHLPGIGPMRMTRLLEAGVLSLEDLLGFPLDELAALPGLNTLVIERARIAAQALVDAAPPAPLPHVPDLPGRAPETPSPVDESSVLATEVTDAQPTSSKRLRWGLEAARRVEPTLDGVRRCRAHCKGSPDLPPVRRELKELRLILERVQRESITHGLSERAYDDLDRLLSKLDRRLDRFAAKEPTAKRAFKMLERVSRARRKLEARIG